MNAAPQVIPHKAPLTITVSWSYTPDFSDAYDIDVSCIAFNPLGQILDAAFYNKNEILHDGIRHLGHNIPPPDATSLHETIIVHLNEINATVLAVVITCMFSCDSSSS
jgi:stress response protein SCP2